MYSNFQDEVQEILSFGPEVNHKLNISIQPTYLESKSKIGEYVFSYKVRIENSSHIESQIIARQWVVTDANNEQQTIRGLGIVGEQPVLKPGQVHEYTSSVVLPTTIGTMKGTYLCITENGDLFPAKIPEFILALPKVLH